MAHTRHVSLQVPHGDKAVFFRINEIKRDTRIRCVRLCAVLQELFAPLQCTVTVPAHTSLCCFCCVQRAPGALQPVLADKCYHAAGKQQPGGGIQ